MKGGGDDVGLEELKEINSSGEGSGRGEVSFPQAVCPSTSVDYEDLSDVIVGVQIEVRQLGWNLQQITQFIADNFQGKRRGQLTDDELVCLLYRLRRRSLEGSA